MPRARHPLVRTLLELRGNPRACLYVEPLWGIGYFLYAPYATLYMSRLGVSDTRIGLLLTVGMTVQMAALFFGSVLIDKFGRRKTTFVLGLFSWCLPAAICMLSQGFWWFLAASVLNGTMMVEAISWNCLLVEDAEPSKLVDMFTWCTVAGLMAVFFAPIAGALVRGMTLVPAIRIVYGFAFVMMTTKTVLLFFLSRETTQGVARREATRGVPYRKLLAQYKGVLGMILHSPATLQVLAVIVMTNITNMVSNTYFALFATRNAGVPEWFVAYFPIARSVIMLLFIFGIQHRLSRYPIRKPMIAGLAAYLLAIALLLLAPSCGIWLLGGYVLLDAFAYALVWPRRNSLLALYVDPDERARITGLLYVLMLAVASPFGWLTGRLSEIDRGWPFVLALGIHAGCALLLLRSRTLAAEGSPEVASERAG
ncbi:MAG: MFS transporter [Clostridia bacterium]|nr:MFS transporter [Clostridia bacterium]